MRGEAHNESSPGSGALGYPGRGWGRQSHAPAVDEPGLWGCRPEELEGAGCQGGCAAIEQNGGDGDASCQLTRVLYQARAVPSDGPRERADDALNHARGHQSGRVWRLTARLRAVEATLLPHLSQEGDTKAVPKLWVGGRDPDPRSCCQEHQRVPRGLVASERCKNCQQPVQGGSNRWAVQERMGEGVKLSWPARCSAVLATGLSWVQDSRTEAEAQSPSHESPVEDAPSGRHVLALQGGVCQQCPHRFASCGGRGQCRAPCRNSSERRRRRRGWRGKRRRGGSRRGRQRLTDTRRGAHLGLPGAGRRARGSPAVAHHPDGWELASPKSRWQAPRGHALLLSSRLGPASLLMREGGGPSCLHGGDASGVPGRRWPPRSRVRRAGPPETRPDP